MASRRWVLAILAVSLCVRVGWAVHAEIRPTADAWQYHQLARSLLDSGRLRLSYQDNGQEGDGYVVAWRTPGYPAFLAALYRLGFTWRGVAIVQALLGALTSLLVVLIGSRVAGPRVGLVAGLLHALSLHSALYTVQLMSETLSIGLVALALWLLLSRRYLWAGLVLGAAILVRPACLFFAPLLVCVPWVQERRLRPGLAALAVTVVTLVPWAARNIVVGVGPVLATHEGHDLFVGNYSGSLGGWDPTAGFMVVRSGLPEGEMNRVFRNEAVAWIVSHPRPYLDLCLLRLWKLYGAAKDVWLSNVAGEWVHALRAPASLFMFFGLLWAFWRSREYWPLLVAVASYSVGLALTFCDSRYQEPLGPFLLIFSAGLLVGAWEAVTSLLRRSSPAAASGGGKASGASIGGRDGTHPSKASKKSGGRHGRKRKSGRRRAGAAQGRDNTSGRRSPP